MINKNPYESPASVDAAESISTAGRRLSTFARFTYSFFAGAVLGLVLFIFMPLLSDSAQVLTAALLITAIWLACAGSAWNLSSTIQIGAISVGAWLGFLIVIGVAVNLENGRFYVDWSRILVSIAVVPTFFTLASLPVRFVARRWHAAGARSSSRIAS